MLSSKEVCETHHVGRWEVDEKAKRFSRRCPRCGEILDRFGFADGQARKYRSLNNYLNGRRSVE